MTPGQTILIRRIWRGNAIVDIAFRLPAIPDYVPSKKAADEKQSNS